MEAGLIKTHTLTGLWCWPYRPMTVFYPVFLLHSFMLLSIVMENNTLDRTIQKEAQKEAKMDK